MPSVHGVRELTAWADKFDYLATLVLEREHDPLPPRVDIREAALEAMQSDSLAHGLLLLPLLDRPGLHQPTRGLVRAGLEAVASSLWEEFPQSGDAFGRALGQWQPHDSRALPFRAVAVALRELLDTSPVWIAATAAEHAEFVRILRETLDRRRWSHPDLADSERAQRLRSSLLLPDFVARHGNAWTPGLVLRAVADVLVDAGSEDTVARAAVAEMIGRMTCPDPAAKQRLRDRVLTPGADPVAALESFAADLIDAVGMTRPTPAPTASPPPAVLLATAEGLLALDRSAARQARFQRGAQDDPLLAHQEWDDLVELDRARAIKGAVNLLSSRQAVPAMAALSVAAGLLDVVAQAPDDPFGRSLTSAVLRRMDDAGLPRAKAAAVADTLGPTSTRDALSPRRVYVGVAKSELGTSRRPSVPRPGRGTHRHDHSPRRG